MPESIRGSVPFGLANDIALELRRNILENLENEDGRGTLRAVRVVSKNWEVAASEYLFNRVYLSCHSADLTAFHNIIGSRFAKYVKTLVKDTGSFNKKLMDFEAFCSLGELHPECIHNYPDFPEHEEDAKKKTRFHDWLAHKCNNDRTRMLELRMEMTKKVYDWWLAHVHEYFMNRQSNAESEAIKEAHAQGVEFKKVIMTSLPVGRDHDDRPDQPFYQPRRSRATIEWKRGLGRLKQELAEEHGLTEFEGLIPQEEILPRVDWVVPDDLLANMLHTQVLDSEPYYGLSLQEWQQNRNAGTATSKCFHPIPVVEPYRGLTSLVRTLLEVSAPVSEFSIVPSRKDRPTDFGNQYTGRFNYNLEEGISAGIFLTNGPDMTNLELLAPQLKVLRLSLHSTWTQGHALSHSYHGLARMLGKAECLEELDLHFSGHQYYSECDLIHRLKLDKLRRARFSDLGFSDRDFCKFVQTHRHTLVELVVFNCGLKDEWRTSEDDAWWWPTLDILRQLRFLDGMSLYINKVGQPDPDVQILEMEGDPTREIGAARWENWVAGRGRFPFGTESCPNQDPESVGRISPEYVDRLRAEVRE